MLQSFFELVLAGAFLSLFLAVGLLFYEFYLLDFFVGEIYPKLAYFVVAA